MATKAQLMKVIDDNDKIRAELEQELKEANDRICTLSAENFKLAVEVDKLKRVIVQKCLDELK